MAGNSNPSLQIDLNEFKLHLHLKGKSPLVLHFNSPSRSFYLSVIALVVYEMKKAGKIKSIPLQEHLDLLALLNETIGGALGSSEMENLLHRIYKKWKDALPNLEEAPVFRVQGKKKKEEGDGAIGKVYSFTDAEKDGWANLFDYMGSEENVRLRFALDKIGVGLNETSIIFGDYRNGEAWDQFIASLKKEEGKGEEKEESAPVEETAVPELPAVPLPASEKPKISWLSRYRWVMVVVVIGIVAVGIWRIFLTPASIEVASVDRMKYPLPDKPSIAVLPFVNLSEDPKQEYFVEGMMDDLITDLSKISGLLVIARNSTFIYKGKSPKAKQIAEELGVRYILEGSVRRAGDEVRVNAQLIDALTGHHLWAERYDGTMNKIFALQDQITQKIVSALAVKLTGSEKELVGQKGTKNVAAYEEFLKGWGHYLRMTSDDMGKAIQSFKKATELDPTYGRAYAALAQAYWTLGQVGELRKGLGVSYLECRFQARQYLKQAMKNPTPIAHVINGQYYLFRRQYEEAMSETERAITLDPNDPLCNWSMAQVSMKVGKLKEAFDFINRGMRLDPHKPLRYLLLLGFVQFSMGNLEETATLFEKGRELNPKYFGNMAWGAATYALLGREQEARAALEFYLKTWEPTGVPLFRVMYFYPFKERAVADRLAEGLIKAGMPGRPSEYFHASKENQLTGKEIEALLFGSTATGIDVITGKQWWIERKKDGQTTYRGPRGSLTGRSWIEGDTCCTQLMGRDRIEGRLDGDVGKEYCFTTFRNPNGTREGMDEYINFSDYGNTPLSVMR